MAIHLREFSVSGVSCSELDAHLLLDWRRMKLSSHLPIPSEIPSFQFFLIFFWYNFIRREYSTRIEITWLPPPFSSSSSSSNDIIIIESFLEKFSSMSSGVVFFWLHRWLRWKWWSVISISVSLYSWTTINGHRHHHQHYSMEWNGQVVAKRCQRWHIAILD